jgi:hypothetical protein
MPRLAKVRREQNAKKMEWFLARIAPAKRRNRERERVKKSVRIQPHKNRTPMMETSN